MPQTPKIINLTPHDINICLTDKCEEKISIPKSGIIARVQQSRKIIGTIKINNIDIPIVKTTYGKVEGLPEKPEQNTYYIVSLVVAQALKDDPEWCKHLLVPDTGPGSVVRDENGRIIGVKYLMSP